MSYKVIVPGAPGGPIEFSFPVHTHLVVPVWRTLQRPGIKARLPRKGVQHENGNQAALAYQDSKYLFDGAGGRQASWHMTVDDKEGYINIPVDEVTWQAGDGAGPGNYNGLSCELSQAMIRDAARTRKARRNAAEMMGRIGARVNAEPPSNRHKDYMLKNCPQFLNADPNAWNQYLADYAYFYKDEKARMSGGSVATPFKVGDRLEVTADAINVRVGYGTQYRVTSTVLKGATMTVIADGSGTFYTYANGYNWVNVRLASGGTGWMATGTSSEVWVKKTAAAPTSPPVVTYAKKVPIPALLETNLKFKDKYNTVEGITTDDENEFIFVADLIEFKTKTKALQVAVPNAASVRADYEEGDRAVAAWLVKNYQGVWFYLLTGGDDEWVRVPYTSTVRISDAPLLGDDME